MRLGPVPRLAPAAGARAPRASRLCKQAVLLRAARVARVSESCPQPRARGDAISYIHTYTICIQTEYIADNSSTWSVARRSTLNIQHVRSTVQSSVWWLRKAATAALTQRALNS
jgi:hypothetical protein